MPVYTVKQGDCIASIAEKHGMQVDTIWNHSDNSDLRNLRKNPNILFPGDKVVIPEKNLASVDAATEVRHTFITKNARIKNKIRILLNGEPLANKNYEVQFDGEWGESGTTDCEGFIEQMISPKYKKAEVTIIEENNTQIFRFNLGSLDPIETDQGVQQRLRMLGYNIQTDLSAVLKKFQRDNGLEESGEIDDVTREKLVKLYGT